MAGHRNDTSCVIVPAVTRKVHGAFTGLAEDLLLLPEMVKEGDLSREAFYLFLY